MLGRYAVSVPFVNSPATDVGLRRDFTRATATSDNLLNCECVVFHRVQGSGFFFHIASAKILRASDCGDISTNTGIGSFVHFSA